VRFYIATKLDNVIAYRQLRDALLERGHVITYDWTTSLGEFQASADRSREICELEVGGVLTADRVFCLMPGGDGTHVELGLAIAKKKPISMWFRSGQAPFEGRPFYHHELIERYDGEFEAFVEKAVRSLANRTWYGQCLVCGTCYEVESELRPCVGSDERSYGAFCPECHEHGLKVVGVVHFEPGESFVEDRGIKPPWPPVS